MFVSDFDLSVWAACFTGHLILLSVLFRKNRYREFPAFTTLIAFNVIRTLILFIIDPRNSAPYFNAYWAFSGIDVALGFAIVYEGASIVFRPAGAWARDVKHALCATLAVSVLVAAILTHIANPETLGPMQGVILKGKFMAATLQAELFVGMMALAARVGLAWRYHVVHICLGLAVYAGFCVIADTTLTCYGIHAGSELFREVSRARIIVYLVCLTYWIVMLSKKAPPGKNMPDHMRKQLAALQERLNADLIRVQALK